MRSVPGRVAGLDGFDASSLSGELVRDFCLDLDVQSNEQVSGKLKASMGFRAARSGLQEMTDIEQVVSTASDVTSLPVETMCLHQSLQALTRLSHPGKCDSCIGIDCGLCG